MWTKCGRFLTEKVGRNSTIVSQKGGQMVAAYGKI